MSSFIISLTIYLLAVNIVAGTIYIFGQKKAGLLWVEYPFIYTPWVIMQFLVPEFMELPGIADMEISLKYFLLMVQGFSCGVMGGAILLPRLFLHSQSVAAKLKVTVVSSLAVGLIYLISRFLLLEMFRWLLL